MPIWIVVAYSLLIPHRLIAVRTVALLVIAQLGLILVCCAALGMTDIVTDHLGGIVRESDYVPYIRQLVGTRKTFCMFAPVVAEERWTPPQVCSFPFEHSRWDTKHTRTRSDDEVLPSDACKRYSVILNA
jgi:hypothetical protein